jgi:hypothetical protein
MATGSLENSSYHPDICNKESLESKMNGGNNSLVTKITAEELAALGGGEFAYVRKIAGTEASAMLGGSMNIPPDAELYCLYNANGAPISISQDYGSALGSAQEHELTPASVH